MASLAHTSGLGSGDATGQAAAVVRAAGPGDALEIALEPKFDFGSEEYRTLFAASSASAFQHPLWLEEFYRTLALARGAEKLVVSIRSGKELVAVLPLIRRQKSAVSLIESTDLGVSDYAAPVTAARWTPGPDIRDRIAAVLPAHDLLRIRPIREETVELWQNLLGGTVSALDFSAHATELAGPFAQWRKRALQPAMAGQLDRKKKRFFKSPAASLRQLVDAGEIGAAIRSVQALRAGRFEGDPIQQDFVCAFYEAVATRGAGGFARTYALELDEERIGYVFGLTWRGRFHYLLIGCDYDRHGRHSPGLLMYDGIIEDWMRDGGTVFDFTIGDEPFKRDFGATPTRMFALWRAATWRGRLALAAAGARSQLRRAGWGRP